MRAELFVVVPYYPLDTCTICSGTHFIPNTANFCLFFFLSVLQVCPLYWSFQNISSVFHDFLIFLFSVSWILLFYYVLPSACFTLLFSSFSRLAGSSDYWFETSFYQHKHFTKGEHLMLLSFPLSTVLELCLKIFYIFSFLSKCFVIIFINFPWSLLLRLLDYLSVPCILQVFGGFPVMLLLLISNLILSLLKNTQWF